MDGTATGILKKLPKFTRPSCVIQSTKNMSAMQYIMPMAPHREFIDALLLSAKIKEGRNQFTMEYPTKMIPNNKIVCIDPFFRSSPLPKSHQSAYIVREFLSACISVQEDTLTHKIHDLEIRRSLIEFGRCFLSGSIPGGVLRMTSSGSEARKLSDAFVTFASCSHDNGGLVCASCAQELYNKARNTGDLIPVACQLGKAVANAILYHSFDANKVRILAHEVANILSHAERVRDEYFWKFSSSAGEDIASYTLTHRSGDALNIEILPGGWMGESSRTGQLFPGNPIVRPCIEFGRTKKAENTKSCRKHYRKSDSHSPGIFTAQCVCRYPKLIGVSVMEECEGVSTALSVLLSRFKKLPRVCYYDNGCNLLKSIVLRVPWVNDECLIASDLFHYRTHKCNVVTDPDSYNLCRRHKTSAAESINQQWNFSKSHIGFYRLKI